MFNPINVILIILFGFLFFIICKGTLKNIVESESYRSKILPKLNWKKLIFNFYLISFGFYISIRLFGLSGTDLSEVLKLKENLWMLELSIFLVVPAFAIFIVSTVTTIVSKLKNYSKETKSYLRLLACLMANRFYLVIVIVNTLIGLIPKFF